MGEMGVHLIDLVRWHFGEFTRVTAQAGVAYSSRSVPGGGKTADAEDFCTVLGELASGGQVTLSASRAARGANEVSVEAYGSQAALVYQLDRDKPQWHVGQLRPPVRDCTPHPSPLHTRLPHSFP